METLDYGAYPHDEDKMTKKEEDAFFAGESAEEREEEMDLIDLQEQEAKEQNDIYEN